MVTIFTSDRKYRVNASLNGVSSNASSLFSEIAPKR